jgi:hypothetical protein
MKESTLDFVSQLIDELYFSNLPRRELVIKALKILSNTEGVSTFLIEGKRKKVIFSSSTISDSDMKLFRYVAKKQYKESITIHYMDDVIFVFPLDFERNSYFALIKINKSKLQDIGDLIRVFKNFVDFIMIYSKHLKNFLGIIRDAFDYSLSNEAKIDGVLSFLSELVLCDAAFVLEYQPTLDVFNVLGSKVKEDIALSKDFIDSEMN